MSNKAFVSNEERDRRLNALAARHGLSLKTEEKPHAPSVTIHMIFHDSDASRLARAHLGADALVTRDDPAYALPPLPLPVVAKGLRSMQAHSRRARAPLILVND